MIQRYWKHVTATTFFDERAVFLSVMIICGQLSAKAPGIGSHCQQQVNQGRDITDGHFMVSIYIGTIEHLRINLIQSRL